VGVEFGFMEVEGLAPIWAVSLIWGADVLVCECVGVWIGPLVGLMGCVVGYI
jgi:hypothetical protein